MKVKRALVSVSDKTGLEKFVKGLDALGVEILSTGGTAKSIRDTGVAVTEASDYTGFPEIMNGRVKTLHPKIHGALLALRDNSEHMRETKKHGIKLIDMVVVNLYPFAQVISKKGVTLEEAIENIDIGGPAMLRSAAKNFKDVAVVSDPGSYECVLEELQKNGCSLSGATLLRLAISAFKKTSEYDNAILRFLQKQPGGITPQEDLFPSVKHVMLDKIQDLRYGENPHQRAAVYRGPFPEETPSIAQAKQLHGKELSFNNILDLNAALEVVLEFDKAAACIIKHATPCGVAEAESIKDAFTGALDCDRMSAFGGIIGLNKKVNEALARKIAGAGFIECVVAPGYDRKALAALAKKKNLRILQAAGSRKASSFGITLDVKRILGGALFQEKDEKDITKKELKVVTKKRPGAEEIDSLYFAWKVAKHVRSNGICLCRGKKTVGIGAGQMSRVDSVIIAVRKAAGLARGAVLASDAFFPKPDSIEIARRAGITSVIQPGGSIADQQVIDAADKAGISMVFTGIRHFKH